MHISGQENASRKSLIKEKQESVDNATFYARLKSMDPEEVLQAIAMVKSGRMDHCIDYIPQQEYQRAKEALNQFIHQATSCRDGNIVQDRGHVQ